MKVNTVYISLEDYNALVEENSRAVEELRHYRSRIAELRGDLRKIEDLIYEAAEKEVDAGHPEYVPFTHIQLKALCAVFQLDPETLANSIKSLKKTVDMGYQE